MAQLSYSKAAGIYLKKCPSSTSSLYPSTQSPEKWPSCRDAYDFTWKSDPDRQINGLSHRNRVKLAHSMGFCPHLRCQLGNLTNSADGNLGLCPQGLCYTKLEEGSPSFGACCFINGSFFSGNIIGFYNKCQATAKPIYRHSRVVLQSEEGEKDEGSEDRFINANRIHSHIIATQCPMKSTLRDVQRMIVQEKISLWIQLTSARQLSGASNHDCHLIPDAWTALTLNKTKPEIKSDWTVRDMADSSHDVHLPHFRFTDVTLSSSQSQSQSRFLHIWYSNWEDFTVPATEDHAAIDSISSLAAERLRRGEKIAINCFSGRGRSGTLAAIILGKLQEVKDHDSLVNLIVAMREHRDGLVEIPAQYRFIAEMLQIQPPLHPYASAIDADDVVASSSSHSSLSSPTYQTPPPPHSMVVALSLLVLLLPLILMFRKIAV